MSPMGGPPSPTDPVTKLADECSYELPLSQYVIGDALGLSRAYVNRVLRQWPKTGSSSSKDRRS
jgi:CRP-like cAMP-binding protein